MAHRLSLLLQIALLPLLIRGLTVQDSWTAPDPSDPAQNVQSGSTFTIRWKSSLRDWFPTYCSSCNLQTIDLWLTSYTNNGYNYKVACKFSLVDAKARMNQLTC